VLLNRGARFLIRLEMMREWCGRNTAWVGHSAPATTLILPPHFPLDPRKYLVNSPVASRFSNGKVLRFGIYPWRAPEAAEWLKIRYILVLNLDSKTHASLASIGPTKLVASWQLNHLNTFFTGSRESNLSPISVELPN
jgi:hypothetical protein